MSELRIHVSTPLVETIVNYLLKHAKQRMDLVVLYVIAHEPVEEYRAKSGKSQKRVSISKEDLWTSLHKYVREDRYLGKRHWLVKKSIPNLVKAGLVQEVPDHYWLTVPEAGFTTDLETLKEVITARFIVEDMLGLKDLLGPMCLQIRDEDWLQEGPERYALVVSP